jgi:alcohol dehydrogenase (NADP+)
MTMTYGSMDKHLNAPTLGGYSQSIVVTEDFVLRMPANLDLAAAAPLLCAGITTYSPLRHWKVGPARRSASSASAASATWASSSPGLRRPRRAVHHVAGKVADGKRLGAHEVVISKDDAQMAAHANSFDFILDAVSATHDINAYLNLLKRDGNLTLVGAPEKPLPVAAFPLIFRRRSFSGSLIGGLPETQEMLDFCGQHNITCDIEMIRMDEINTAYERMLKSDVKYRSSKFFMAVVRYRAVTAAFIACQFRHHIQGAARWLGFAHVLHSILRQLPGNVCAVSHGDDDERDARDSLHF